MMKLTSSIQVIATPDGNFAISGITPGALAEIAGAVTKELCPTQFQAVLFTHLLEHLSDPSRLNIALRRCGESGHNPQLVELLVLIWHNDHFCDSDRKPYVLPTEDNSTPPSTLSSDVGVKPDEAAGS